MSNSMLLVLFTLVFDDLTIVTVLWKKNFWRFNCWLFSDFLLPLLEQGHIPAFHLVTAMPVTLILYICKEIFLHKQFLKHLPRSRRHFFFIFLELYLFESLHYLMDKWCLWFLINLRWLLQTAWVWQIILLSKILK